MGRGRDYTFPDVLEMFEVLVRNKVDFVVIGGVAVSQHGFERTTKDLDVVTDPSPDNIEKLWAALVELEADVSSLPDVRPDALPVPWSLESLQQGGTWLLDTKYGQLHVMQCLVGKVEDEADYKRLRERAQRSRYDFGTVWFVSYSDLIELKYIAGREQDMTDIRALEEARGTAGPES